MRATTADVGPSCAVTFALLKRQLPVLRSGHIALGQIASCQPKEVAVWGHGIIRRTTHRQVLKIFIFAPRLAVSHRQRVQPS